MSETERAILATQQAELVRALVANSPCPHGFDPKEMASLSKSLIRKRIKEVNQAWPILQNQRATHWEAEFCDYASQNPPPPGGPAEDGYRFLVQLSRGNQDFWIHFAVAQWELIHARGGGNGIFRKVPGSFKWMIGLAFRNRIFLLKRFPW